MQGELVSQIRSQLKFRIKYTHLYISLSFSFNFLTSSRQTEQRKFVYGGETHSDLYSRQFFGLHIQAGHLDFYTTDPLSNKYLNLNLNLSL